MEGNKITKKTNQKLHSNLIDEGVNFLEKQGFWRIKTPNNFSKFVNLNPDFLMIKHNGVWKENYPDKWPSEITIIWGEAIHSSFRGLPKTDDIKKGIKETISEYAIWKNAEVTYNISDNRHKTVKYFEGWQSRKKNKKIEFKIRYYLVLKNGIWECTQRKLLCVFTNEGEQCGTE
jgi:hypothetical protein